MVEENLRGSGCVRAVSISIEVKIPLLKSFDGQVKVTHSRFCKRYQTSEGVVICEHVTACGLYVTELRVRMSV